VPFLEGSLVGLEKITLVLQNALMRSIEGVLSLPRLREADLPDHCLGLGFVDAHRVLASSGWCDCAWAFNLR